jgi:hypothetical protein
VTDSICPENPGWLTLTPIIQDVAAAAHRIELIDGAVMALQQQRLAKGDART